MGVSPEQLAQQLADNNQINFAAAEVLRGKAMNLIAERVKVTDDVGQPGRHRHRPQRAPEARRDAADADAADHEPRRPGRDEDADESRRGTTRPGTADRAKA